MEDLWRHRTAAASDSTDGAVRRIGWEQTQEWCNFVVLRPTEFPAGLVVDNLTLRPEAPPGRECVDATGRSPGNIANRSSLRFELAGKGCRLRVKQFLYDWAPPAFDHPSLWLSAEVRPFVVGDDLGWLGKDYRSLPAASFHLDRTMVEVSVTEGSVADRELETLCRGLRPLDPEVRSRILATPFAELCYQSRHDEDVITVPVAYWAYQRTPPSLRTTALPATAAPANLPGSSIFPVSSSNYELDSVFLFGDPDDPHEIEYLYELADARGRYVRLLVWPGDASAGPGYPPKLDRQSCWHQFLTIRNEKEGTATEAYHAYLDDRYGPHCAVWRSADFVAMVLVKPLIWTDQSWFFKFVGELLA